MSTIRSCRGFLLLSILVVALGATAVFARAEPLTFEQLAAIRSVGDVKIAPDGQTLAYTVSVPRKPGVDDDGPAWVELHVRKIGAKEGRAFVRGEVNVSQVAFSPDGAWLTYVAKRNGDDHRALWAIPVDGGESLRLLEFDSNIADYALAPDGRRVAIVAVEPEDKARKKARDKGYKQEVFEEDNRPRRVWVAALPSPDGPPADPEADDEAEAPEPVPFDIGDASAFEVAWSRDGSRLALTLAPSPRIDDQYMHRRVHVFDPGTGKLVAKFDNPGKLGPLALSPDGRHVAMISAADPNDPKEGRLLVAPTSGGKLRDVLPGLPGHVQRLAWKDDSTLAFIADMGAETEFGEVDIANGERKIRFRSGGGSGNPILTALSVAPVGQRVAFVGEKPAHSSEVYTLGRDESSPQRVTRTNPWLDEVALATQEVIRHPARDGLELEGILLRPLGDEGGPAPLMMIVHGGPESHVRNGWITSYSRPGQLAAGQGYAVFYPNYRGSTGRGVEFSKTSQGDAAGKEFDDLVDAVDHLIAAGIADRDRVGITGGSYGGYATAWCSTRYSERFKAGVMFVGISNKVSKGLTTEIPVEDKMVHTLFDPWTRWQFSLERSPIYHVENARTALLIAGGTADSRVHPSQSLQLYRALKLVDKAPVRYVRYPGEGHGNRNAAARDDYSRRLMRWMDHFVRDLQADLPPWELGSGPASEVAEGEQG